jgi:hypothetical protein
MKFDLSKAKLGPDGKLTPESVAAVMAFVNSVDTIKVVDMTKKKPTTKIMRLKPIRNA